MVFFAIKDLKSGAYLPHAEGKRAATHVKLSSKKPPRLFTTQSAAKNALDWWKGGEHYNKWYTDHNGEQDFSLERDKVLDRLDTQMVIVKVSLHKLNYCLTK